MAPQLMYFRMVVLVLTFTSLTAAKKTASAATRRHYSNCKTASEALIIAISIAVDSKPEEHYNCISHIYALSSTSPDQQQIDTSSKSSVTTQQQYYSVALQ